LLVFVAAERLELEGLLVHVDELSQPDWPLDFARLGRLHGVPIAMVANGPGPKLAGDAVDVVKANQNMDALISIGFCGGLQASLKACDIFVPSEIVGISPVRQPASQRPFKTGKLLSMDRVVSTAAEKTALGQSGADAVEMEAAAVVARANQCGVPFYAVRVVTDTCDQDFPVDFNRMRSPDGRFSRSRIIAAALRKPGTVIPQLIKLKRTTKRAALALGDFLADARF
jgi:nucleoside phosphorylase